MKSRRIHITGASGAGVTTLGRALADALAVAHHDTDDYFWQPTSPPYQHARKKADRLRLIQEIFLGRDGWVLSGSLDGWGDPLIPYFDLVVFLHTAQTFRLNRLRAREATRFGADAVAPAAGGIKRWKILSNGRRATMTATSPFAACKTIRPGLRHCPARCCASTARGHCLNW
jgi:hypothetical protein